MFFISKLIIHCNLKYCGTVPIININIFAILYVLLCFNVKSELSQLSFLLMWLIAGYQNHM